MNLKINSYESLTVRKESDWQGPLLLVTEVDEEEIMEQFDDRDRRRLISQIPLSEIIEYHGAEEILETIGRARVEEHAKEYWAESDEEQ